MIEEEICIWSLSLISGTRVQKILVNFLIRVKVMPFVIPNKLTSIVPEFMLMTFGGLLDSFKMVARGTNHVIGGL